MDMCRKAESRLHARTAADDVHTVRRSPGGVELDCYEAVVLQQQRFEGHGCQTQAVVASNHCSRIPEARLEVPRQDCCALQRKQDFIRRGALCRCIWFANNAVHRRLYSGSCKIANSLFEDL